MSAVACLRVMIGEPVHCPPGVNLAALVGKIAGAYLESTWIWPRRFAVVAPFAFALTDPRAIQLDARELQALARDLHLKLFGERGQGDIQLLMLEGDQAEVMRFASARPEELASILRGEEAGFTGRLCRITASDAVAIQPPGATVEGAPPLDVVAVTPPPPTDGVDVIEEFRRGLIENDERGDRFEWAGLYIFGHERFIGSRLLPQGGRFLDQAGEEALARDLAGIDCVNAAAKGGAQGYLIANVDFTALVRRSGRNALVERLADAPSEERGRLGVTIRNVPREPSFPAMQQVAALLHPNFAMLDLRVSDPEFQIASLPRGISMVALELEKGEERRRLAAIKRFAEHRLEYRQKRVWQGVVGLRTHREVELCNALGLQLGSGPAISERLDRPWDLRAWSMAKLPRPRQSLTAHEKGDPGDRAAFSDALDFRA